METIALAVAAFASTNVDDFFLLTLWFLRRTSLRIVVIGQFIGFTIIVLVSVVGYFGTTLIPPQYIRWLGFLPMAIGVKQIWAKHSESSEPSDSWWAVAVVTAAHGADNIAVYIPLFARVTPSGVGIMVMCFYFMLALWVAVTNLSARTFAQHSGVHRFAHRVSPFVLILIGIIILAG